MKKKFFPVPFGEISQCFQNFAKGSRANYKGAPVIYRGHKAETKGTVRPPRRPDGVAKGSRMSDKGAPLNYKGHKGEQRETLGGRPKFSKFLGFSGDWQRLHCELKL